MYIYIQVKSHTSWETNQLDPYCTRPCSQVSRHGDISVASGAAAQEPHVEPARPLPFLAPGGNAQLDGEVRRERKGMMALIDTIIQEHEADRCAGSGNKDLLDVLFRV
jgi:hypothetical protein